MINQVSPSKQIAFFRKLSVVKVENRSQISTSYPQQIQQTNEMSYFFSDAYTSLLFADWGVHLNICRLRKLEVCCRYSRNKPYSLRSVLLRCCTGGKLSLITVTRSSKL